MKKLLFSTSLMLFLMGCSHSTEISQVEPLPQPVPQATPAPVEKQMWVTTDRLNRRTCPSQSCGSVGQLFFREGATVLEEKNGWVRITQYYNASCENGESVYVDSGNSTCSAENGINDEQFAEWVLKSHLSETRPADPAADASGDYTLVQNSDDYRRYKDVFAKSARSLITEGTCSETDFQEWGGWTKSTNHRDEPIYFMYCGGMSRENRLYLNASSGETFK